MQAIILAGGKGERLRPFTNDRPKPMVEVLGYPILGYQMQWLQTQGVDEVVISCGYRHEVIQSYFGDGEKYGLRLSYAVEHEPLGRGGGLKKAFGQLSQPANNDDIVIGTNGDVITNLNLAPAIESHRARGGLCTIVLTPFLSPYGIVEVDEENHVLGFREKPELPYWINGGIYILSRAIYDYLPDQGDHEDTTFPRLAQERRLHAYPSRAFWRSVDTVKDLSEVTKELEQRLIAALLSGQAGYEG
jgi:NDP-sugar pyrophosphorylase family protein